MAAGLQPPLSDALASEDFGVYFSLLPSRWLRSKESRVRDKISRVYAGFPISKCGNGSRAVHRAVASRAKRVEKAPITRDILPVRRRRRTRRRSVPIPREIAISSRRAVRAREVHASRVTRGNIPRENFRDWRLSNRRRSLAPARARARASRNFSRVCNNIRDGWYLVRSEERREREGQRDKVTTKNVTDRRGGGRVAGFVRYYLTCDSWLCPAW